MGIGKRGERKSQGEGLSWKHATCDYNGRTGGKGKSIVSGMSKYFRDKWYRDHANEIKLWWQSVKHMPAPRLDPNY